MALLLQAYGTPAQHRPSASGEGLAFAPISHLCGGPRARESAPRHRTSAACDSGGAGRPGRSDPGDPLCICAQGYYPRTAFKNASHREIACACAHGPPSPSPWAMPAVPGTVRRRRGGRRGVRACTSPALPSAHTHSGLRAPRPVSRCGRCAHRDRPPVPSRAGGRRRLRTQLGQARGRTFWRARVARGRFLLYSKTN